MAESLLGLGIWYASRPTIRPTLHRFGDDHAPLVATFIGCTGIVIYFTLAQMFIPALQ